MDAPGPSKTLTDRQVWCITTVTVSCRALVRSLSNLMALQGVEDTRQLFLSGIKAWGKCSLSKVSVYVSEFLAHDAVGVGGAAPSWVLFRTLQQRRLWLWGRFKLCWPFRASWAFPYCCRLWGSGLVVLLILISVVYLGFTENRNEQHVAAIQLVQKDNNPFFRSKISIL